MQDCGLLLCVFVLFCDKNSSLFSAGGPRLLIRSFVYQFGDNRTTLKWSPDVDERIRVNISLEIICSQLGYIFDGRSAQWCRKHKAYSGKNKLGTM